MRRAGVLKTMPAVKCAANATLALLCACAAPLANAPHFSASAAAPRPQSQNGDLLYVVNFGTGTVDVYGYPDGPLVQKLSGFSHPEGACTDTAGDVFVTNTGGHDIVEYTHGGTRIARTLSDGDYHPADCAVDPQTGNLAVANDNGGSHGSGNVAVYHGARGTPQYFTGLHSYLTCAYDDRGNLFVDGTSDDDYYLQELAKGATTFRMIHFQNFEVLRHIGWDGSYITDEVPENNWSAIYRFKIAGVKGRFEGATTVSRRGSAFIARPRVVITGESEVTLFDYPSGQGPTRTIVDHNRPVASVVSFTPK